MARTDNQTAFIARERELAILLQRLASAGRGEGGVVLIAGEPGIGKTRLMEKLSERARVGEWHVLTGHAYESEGMPPYLPFIEALQEHVLACPLDELRAQLGEGAADVALLVREIRTRLPDLPHSQPLGPDERYRLFESVSDFLVSIARSPRSGLLLCLDDLQWADDASLLLLEHLARRLLEQRLLVLGTYRNTEVDAARPLARTPEQLMRQRLGQRIDVERLSKDEVGVMLAALADQQAPPAFVDVIFAETEGNPFFVQEVFEHLAEEDRLFDARGDWRSDLRIDELDVPQGVRLVIGRRLQRVSEGCRSVLSIGSVIGRTFSHEFLSSVARLDEEDLLKAMEEADRAHLIVFDHSGAVTFAHELIRQTLLSELSPPRRQSFHLRIAEAMEALYVGGIHEQAPGLAEHFSYSSDQTNLAKAVSYGRIAAQRAMSLYAYAEAVRLLEQALHVHELADPDSLSGSLEAQSKRCDLLLALAEALNPAGEPHRVYERVAEEAFALADALGDHERAGRACRAALLALLRYGSNKVQGTPVYSRWVQRADRTAVSGTVDRVWADVFLGDVQFTIGRIAEGRILYFRGLELARELAQPEALFLGAWGIICGVDWPPEHQSERLTVTHEMQGWPRDGVGVRLQASVLFFGSKVLLSWGERPLAEELWEDVRTLGERTREPNLELFSLWSEGHTLVLAGELESAVALGAQMVARGEEIGAPLAGRKFAEQLTLQPLLWLGRREELIEWLSEASMEGSGIGPELDSARRSLVTASVGQNEEAAATVRRLLEERAHRHNGEGIGTTTLTHILETAVTVGDAELAAALQPRLAGLGKMVNMDSDCLTVIARLLGATAALLGESEEARRYYEQALEVCAKIGFRPEIGLTHLGLAELLLRHYPRERAEALEHLDFAISEFEAMKMQPSLERALRLRGRRRAPAERPEPTYPDGLSEREVDVLRLIAAGKSNNEIAEKLVLSVRTVERHITNIYAKIDARGRADAATYVLRHGLSSTA